MKKTQPPLKRRLVTHNSTPQHEAPTPPTVTATTVDPIAILERIANWPANSNSEPDVMGDALDQIQQLAPTLLKASDHKPVKAAPEC